jgi:sterol desaturase/sphingolipid hydroxylase (fatty acid hydroxylase superfamily)
MFWASKKYHLEDMTFSELVKAYIQYPAIQVYFMIAFVAAITISMQGLWSLLHVFIAVIVAFIYPLIWYLLHRFVLHSQHLYRSPKFAKMWKRIHFDHHSDPNDLRVLFGALHTTLPTVAICTMPIGGLIDGWIGAIVAVSAGVIVTMFYEFCHCIQHLHYTPSIKFFKTIKRFHLLHHFRNENGNYGITNYFWDKLFRTYYDKDDKWKKSPTVFNLGYDEQQAEKYPWVAELTKATK